MSGSLIISFIISITIIGTFSLLMDSLDITKNTKEILNNHDLADTRNDSTLVNNDYECDDYFEE